MPRQARIDAPLALHHIIIRGIERKKIFEDDKDREDFLERLSGLVEETMTPSVKSTLKQRPVQAKDALDADALSNHPDA